jgi:hypothetical protein
MANFPTSVSTNANLYVAVNGLQTTLAATITDSDTTISLTSTSNFPSTGLVTIDNNEVVSYSGISGADLTGCVRGADGTSALPHNLGVTVGLTVVATHHNLLKDEVIAVETALGAGFAKGNLSEVTSSVLTVSGGTGAVIGSGTTIAVQAATDALPGYMTASDHTALTGTIATANAALPTAGGTMTGDITMSNQKAIIFKETTGNGTDSVTLKAPASVTSSYSIQLPSAVASAGQSFVDTAGDGILSWATVTSGITQLTSDVTAGPGSGSQAATVAYVGGTAAATIAASVTTANNALPKAGGTMAGNIAMGTNKVTGLGAATTNGDAVRYEQVNGQYLPIGGGTLTGVTLLPDGSAAAPALAFGADTNTGIWRGGTDTVGLTTGGINRFLITTTSVATALPTAIQGTTTNDSASSGYVGEYVSSTQTFTAVPGASGDYGDALSISLTAGDWDVFFTGSLLPIGTVGGNISFGISTTSGNSSTGIVDGDTNQFLNPAATNTMGATVYSRQSLSSTTTVYAKVRVQTYTGGPPQVACKLSARRVR